ncbi:MAG: hypothetical protein AB7Q97_10305 [Gammaproteobacteria bacterium]
MSITVHEFKRLLGGVARSAKLKTTTDEDYKRRRDKFEKSVKALKALGGDVTEFEKALKEADNLKKTDLVKAYVALEKPRAQVEAALRTAHTDAFKKDGYSEKKAKRMAAYATELDAEGMDKDRVVLAAKVNQSLVDDGIPEEKAAAVGRVTRTGGKGDLEDAKVVAKKVAIFPSKMLETMHKNGTDVIACKDSITDYHTDLKGVQPRGWPNGSTWDQVPGAGGAKEVVIATKGTGGGKHVPAQGEGHGAFDLFGHEAGHGFDFGGGKPFKSEDAKFRKARKKDVDDGKMRGSGSTTPGTDDYFMTTGEGGIQADLDAANQEAFAESCARYYGKDANLKKDWPELHKFWAAKPFE